MSYRLPTLIVTPGDAPAHWDAFLHWPNGDMERAEVAATSAGAAIRTAAGRFDIFDFAYRIR